MYAQIRGKIVESLPNEVVVDAGGVGFQILISLSSFAKLPPIGSEVTLYTAHIVREEFQGLYGFLTKEEKSFFLQLLTVSGVGPKLALSVTGHLSVKQLEEAIHSQDAKLLSKIPGVGKKIAERLLLEMKDRVKGESAGTKGVIPVSCEVTHALLTLGYSLVEAKKQADKAREALGDKAPLSELIKRALQLGSQEYSLKN